MQQQQREGGQQRAHITCWLYLLGMFRIMSVVRVSAPDMTFSRTSGNLERPPEVK